MPRTLSRQLTYPRWSGTTAELRQAYVETQCAVSWDHLLVRLRDGLTLTAALQKPNRQTHQAPPPKRRRRPARRQEVWEALAEAVETAQQPPRRQELRVTTGSRAREAARIDALIAARRAQGYGAPDPAPPVLTDMDPMAETREALRRKRDMALVRSLLTEAVPWLGAAPRPARRPADASDGPGVNGTVAPPGTERGRGR